MTNFFKAFGLVVVGAVVGVLVAVSFGASQFGVGAVYSNVTKYFPEGISVGTTGQFAVSKAGVVSTTGAISTSGAVSTSAGSLSVTGTGTSTVAVTTTSTTKGVCFNLIATSSATAINMTFAASTTAASTVGIVPILRYGVCP